MTPLATMPTLSVSPRQVVQRLLADASLRSVTIDPRTGEALLCYRDRHVDRATLASLAERVRAESATLASTGVIPLPAAIECWLDEATGRESYVRSPEQATGWRRAMHLTLAALWFTLAVLGAILPGLPCTCFLLLTSYSLCRSSKRLHERLLNSQWFGPMLRHWRVHRGVRPGVKTKALTMLVMMVGASLAFAPLPTVAWWAVAAAGAMGVWCVSRLRVVAS